MKIIPPLFIPPWERSGRKGAAVAKSEPELPLKPASQTQMTAHLKVKPGLPCKHNLKPANQTRMKTQPDLKADTFHNQVKQVNKVKQANQLNQVKQ